jgi:hypothetical protein
MFVRQSLDVPAKYGTAEKAYFKTTKRHTSWPPPPGVPVWWTNGRYGHVAISAGDGYCYSSDYKRHGKIDKVLISSITKGWGQRYRGWSEDINDVRVYTAAAKITKIDASNVAAAAKARKSVTGGSTLKRAVAKEVGKGTMDLSNAILGGGFKTQYSLVQKKYFKVKGWKPKPGDTDGIPGIATLSWLGHRRGFQVKK